MTTTTEEAERLARCGLDFMEDLPCRDYGILIDAGDLVDMGTAIRSLAAERDALRAENARLREALLLARVAVSHACELSDRILYTQDLVRIDAALGEKE